MFLKHPEPGTDNDPTTTVFGAVGTGNESRLAFAFRDGSTLNGDLRYRAAIGGGSLNLDFFPTASDRGITINNKAVFAFASAEYRVASSRFYVGPSLTLLSTDVSPRAPSGVQLPAFLTQKVKLNALGIQAHYDTRDNPFTPRNGVDANIKLKRFDEALGSDADYYSSELFGTYFYSPDDKWTLSGMALVQATYGDAPFFLEPSISLRGVPINRYQGNNVISAELEVRHQLTPRWSVLGFAGYGRTSSNDARDITEDFRAHTWGAGFRYRIARNFGLDAGLDIARGPEDTTVYIQFGHAWGQWMD